MPDKRVTELDPIAAVTGTDLVMVVDGAGNKKATVTQVLASPVPYFDFSENAAPGDPAAARARIHALNANGFTVLEVRDGNANVVRLASDNVLVGKVSVAGGITRGQVVYLSGASGANPLLGLAKADAIETLPCIGMALDPGANNAFIRVLLVGTLELLNTGAFAEGDRLYVSPTVAGGMTTVAPVAPAFTQRIGIVLRSHASQGSVVVLTTGVMPPAAALLRTPDLEQQLAELRARVDALERA